MRFIIAAIVLASNVATFFFSSSTDLKVQQLIYIKHLATEEEIKSVVNKLTKKLLEDIINNIKN